MKIKLLISAAAIALVAGPTSVSAAGPFTTVEGTAAQPLTAIQLSAVRAADGLHLADPTAAAAVGGLASAIGVGHSKSLVIKSSTSTTMA